MTDELLPYFGRPPAREPQPAAEAVTLRGKRVILSLPDGFVYDVRAVSEVVERERVPSVEVTTEEDYFRWMFTGQTPTRTTYPLRLVWLD